MKLADIILKDLECLLMLGADKVYNLLVQKCLCLKRACKAGIAAKILVADCFHRNHIKIITHTIA